jgi:hypothetical protein
VLRSSPRRGSWKCARSRHDLVRQVGLHRARGDDFLLLFHDTHHRAITEPEAMAAYDLSHFDGVLAFGKILRDLYLERGWTGRAWTWHEAADTRVFRPIASDERDGDLVWIGNWGDEERTAELHEFLLGPVHRLALSAHVHGVRYPQHAKASLADAGIAYGGCPRDREGGTASSAGRAPSAVKECEMGSRPSATAQRSGSGMHARSGTKDAATPSHRRGALLREKIDVCQWFHFEDHAAVDRTIGLMADLGAKHLRTGISWADYYRQGGKAWYDWQMKRLAESGLEVLLSVWHTPPSISEADACNAPPRRLRDYADFIDLLITDYGDAFSHLELWNEPNNRLKWDFPRFDPWWRKFGEMVGAAAYWARQRGKRTVLGGMIPVDHHWLNLMEQYGVLEQVDVVGIHAFPGMWFPAHPNWDWQRDWKGWDQKLAYIGEHSRGRPIWVTETGIATWDLALSREAKYELQEQAINDLAAAEGERFYFYSLIDLDPAREAIEGFHVDENEYHMGLVKHDGYRKTAYGRLQELLRD